jgi:hypothetical protein
MKFGELIDQAVECIKSYNPVYKKPSKMKDIQGNPETLQIETAYEFGKKKVRSKVSMKQLKKDILFLKK